MHCDFFYKAFIIVYNYIVSLPTVFSLSDKVERIGNLKHDFQSSPLL